MKKLKFKYGNINRKIYLIKADKEASVKFITEWFSKNHNWLSTAFSDEKFNLDGPDHWCTYMTGNDDAFRENGQCKGGCVMVWPMASLPTNLSKGFLSNQIIIYIYWKISFSIFCLQIMIIIALYIRQLHKRFLKNFQNLKLEMTLEKFWYQLGSERVKNDFWICIRWPTI